MMRPKIHRSKKNENSAGVIPPAQTNGSSCLPQTEEEAVALERLHVHQVYEEIADHFSDTRHKPWPQIAQFLMEQEPGSILVDIGCGNGKYFGVNSQLCQIGSDRSENLANIVRSRGFQVFVGDVLAIPLRSASVDVGLCIAVIHHLSTEARRKQAIEELVRILRPGGCVLIYVWAQQQQKDNQKSTYLKPHGQYKKEARTQKANTQDTETLPLSGTETLPLSGTETLPLLGTETLPPSGTETLPLSGTETLPLLGTETLPLLGTETLPISGTETLPPSGTETLPLLGTETLPLSGTERLPPSGTETLPLSGTETLPASGTETLPLPGTETLPPSGTETLPPSGTETLPPSGTETLPPSGTETLPSGTETLPLSGTETLPLSGTETLREQFPEQTVISCPSKADSVYGNKPETLSAGDSFKQDEKSKCCGDLETEGKDDETQLPGKEQEINESSTTSPSSRTLQVHVNRTEFKERDMLVPWQLKKSRNKDHEAVDRDCKERQTFHRFYHVFQRGELDALCSEVPGCVVTRSYYDQGNWCVLLQKSETP